MNKIVFATLCAAMMSTSVAVFRRGGGGHGSGGGHGGGHSSGHTSTHTSSTHHTSAPKVPHTATPKTTHVAAPKATVTHVKTYSKPSTGKVVQEHNRTAPNKTQKDNWSSKPNTNPETGKPGTKTPQK